MAKSTNYLSGKEIRQIAKENNKVMKRLEAYKYRKCDESEYLTEMKDNRNILEIEELHTYFFTEQGVVKAVNGVSLDIPRNATVGIVGESGCGKSVTSMSVMRLLQGPTGQIYSGEIRFNAKDEDGQEKNYDIAKMPIRDIHKKDATKEDAKAKSMEMLNLVGIAAPERVYDAFPHELSGGMRQRVMIAMALAADPRLIIADEPTTALDVTIQAQILDLLRDLKDKIDGSIMLITHDLGIIAEMADYVVVMYAGKVIEKGTAREIFHNPMHPYTIGLQKSKPTLKSDSDQLFNIPGNVPNPVNMPNYCYFKERCDKCIGKCSGDYPCMVQVSPTHYVACHLYGEEEKTNGQ